MTEHAVSSSLPAGLDDTSPDDATRDYTADVHARPDEVCFRYVIDMASLAR